MIFEQAAEPDVRNPILIAAMQDMGNVGGISIDFVNRSLATSTFRTATPDHPTHIIDCGGYIEVPDESWEYRYADGVIVFGGGRGQPEGAEMGQLCRDVMQIAAKYSARFVYTLGGFHTTTPSSPRRAYVTATSRDIARQMEQMGIPATPQRSAITGFNGIILGFAKQKGIDGIGIYGELDRPDTEQYKAAASVIRTLEKLTYRKMGGAGDLEAMMRG